MSDDITTAAMDALEIIRVLEQQQDDEPPTPEQLRERGFPEPTT